MPESHTAWRAIGVAVQGASHLKGKLPCQDCVEWAEAPNQVLVAAVADGAGSATESERGSRMACSAAISFLKETLASKPALSSESTRRILEEAVIHARNAILAEAQAGKIAPREFGTTLLLLLARKDFAAAIQIGDGAIIIRDADGKLIALTKPPSAEYLNETTFLTAEDALASAQFAARADSVAGAAMFTDGLQMLALKMPEGLPHPPFFAPLFGYLEREADMSAARERLGAFLGSPKITERADDDLTLFFALWREGA